MLSGLLCTCRPDPTCRRKHVCSETSMMREQLGFGLRTPWAHAPHSTHRPHSSSFLGLPYRVLNMNPKKELLWGLWVGARTADAQGYNTLQHPSGILAQTILEILEVDTSLSTIRTAGTRHRMRASPIALSRPCRCHCRAATLESCRQWSRRSLRSSNSASTQTSCFAYDPVLPRSRT